MIKELQHSITMLVALEHQRDLAAKIQKNIADGNHTYLMIDKIDADAGDWGAYFHFSNNKALQNHIKLALDIELTEIQKQIEQTQRKMHNLLGQSLPLQP